MIFYAFNMNNDDDKYHLYKTSLYSNNPKRGFSQRSRMKPKKQFLLVKMSGTLALENDMNYIIYYRFLVIFRKLMD